MRLRREVAPFALERNQFFWYNCSSRDSNGAAILGADGVDASVPSSFVAVVGLFFLQANRDQHARAPHHVPDRRPHRGVAGEERRAGRAARDAAPAHAGRARHPRRAVPSGLRRRRTGAAPTAARDRRRRALCPRGARSPTPLPSHTAPAPPLGASAWTVAWAEPPHALLAFRLSRCGAGAQAQAHARAYAQAYAHA